jgi:hypothetical protein
MIGTPKWVYYTDWTERFLESLVITPMALAMGALLGAILGLGTQMLADIGRWVLDRVP